MSIKGAIVERLPVPDPMNSQWVWITAQLLATLPRSSNLYIFVLSLYVLGVFLVGLVLLKVSLYLWSVYRQRLFEPGKQARVFGWALGVAFFFALVGCALIVSQDNILSYYGYYVLAYTFGALTVFTAFYDWWVDRPHSKALPSLKGMSAEEVIKMHKTVSGAGR